MKTQPKTCYVAIARLIDGNRNRAATAEDLEWEEAIDRGTIPHVRGTENHVCGTINHSHSKSQNHITHLQLN